MNKTLSILILIIATGAITGCQSTKWSKESLHNLNPIKKFANVKETAKKSKSKFEEPVRMAVIWSDGVYDEVGKPKVRGFGARIYFYNEDGEPIKTDGELIVYGYDDDKQHTGLSADRKYVFRQSEFQTHFSESSLGNSYSVWVPWEKVGGMRKSVSLIPVFKTAQGNVLRGGQSVNVLPGFDPETNEVINSEIKISKNVIQMAHEGKFHNRVATADYEQDVAKPSASPQSPSKKKREATTIAVPKSMADKLASGANFFSFPNRPKPTPQKRDAAKDVSQPKSQPSAPTPKTESKGIRPFGLPGH